MSAKLTVKVCNYLHRPTFKDVIRPRKQADGGYLMSKSAHALSSESQIHLMSYSHEENKYIPRTADFLGRVWTRKREM